MAVGRGALSVLIVCLGSATPTWADGVASPPYGAAELRQTAANLRGYARTLEQAAAEKRKITDNAWKARARSTVDRACELAKAFDEWDDNLPSAAAGAWFQCAHVGTTGSKGCFAKIEADLSFGGVAGYPLLARDMVSSAISLEGFARCLNAPSDAQRKAEADKRAREDKERLEREKREQEQEREAERQREDARLRDKQKRDDELKREQDQRERDQKQRDEQRSQHAQQTPSKSGPTGGGGSTSSTSSSPKGAAGAAAGGASLGAATVTALAGGAVLMGLGAHMEVKDAVTPFEIGFGAAVGMVRGGFMVGGAIEARYLHWNPTTRSPRPRIEQPTGPMQAGDRVQAKWTDGGWYNGNVAAVQPDGTYDVDFDGGRKLQALPAFDVRVPGVKTDEELEAEELKETLGQLTGHEAYGGLALGGLFGSDTVCEPAPCRSQVTSGSVVYAEAGYRYWIRRWGVGGVVSYMSGGAGDSTRTCDGRRERDCEGGRNATIGAEGLFAFPSRGSRKILLVTGIRLFPFDPGIAVLFRGGANRMLLNIDIGTSELGFFTTVGMGMRFAL